ncbi:glycosyltransferase family 2 protein [Piromyces sp. E2]|nr:glycosyltransferase family 2 protein [Piromyces sp. E2]|eukprot:OUM59288.1 glycosyltransferase family 2 protein [Piromyces sp. E2]
MELFYFFLGFIIGISVVKTALWTLGFYGLIVVLHYIFQSIFAYLNYRKVTKNRNNRSKDWIGVSTGLLVVGYKEDPELFKGCLESIITINYARNEKVIVIVDGNDTEDRYMGDIFAKVFSKWDHRVITTDFKIQDVGISEPRAIKLLEEVKKCTGPVCIMQPHHGKRSAMYTGFQLLLQCQVDAVVVTDSDTILDKDCIKELAFMLEDKYVGAATGDVKIYNTNKMLSFLSSLRYWFAFNLERSCQSFHNCVTCVSGPLGIYRSEVLRKCLDRWINQKFLGSPCTYGDDRHLTNLTLALGVSVKYTPYAMCHTETPETFVRWVTQQTRWSKSFYREAIYAIKVCPTQSLWMTYELIFHTIYPYILIYSLVTLIYTGDFWQLITRVLTLFFMGGLKCIYALLLTRNPKFLLNFLYGIIYMIGFIPAKIQALLFLWDNGWGTSSRLKKSSSKCTQFLIPFLWVAVLVVGVIVNVRRFILSDTEKFETHHLVGILVMVGILIVAYIHYLIYQRMKKRQREALKKEKLNNNSNIDMVMV